ANRDQRLELIRARKVRRPDLELQLGAGDGRKAGVGFRKEGALRGGEGKGGIGRQLREPAELLFLLAQLPGDLCSRARVAAGQLVRVHLSLSELAEVALDSGQFASELTKVALCLLDRALCSLLPAPFVFAPKDPTDALFEKTLVCTRGAESRHA